MIHIVVCSVSTVMCDFYYAILLSTSGIAWIEFLNSNDNLGDVLTHIREGDIPGAQLLWLRYEVMKQLHTLT